jgi:hypothetical protein
VTNTAPAARTALALREAMTRLLAGEPQRTDGRLTKANLGREAGVSHATLHRAKNILREWETAVAACDTRTPAEARHHDEAQTPRSRLAAKTREYTDLRRRLDDAATVIATLHHENTALRAQLSRQGTVVPIGSPRPEPPHPERVS